MTGKTHIAIGIVTGLAFAAGKPIKVQLPLVLASVVGSLAPDLDHPKAKLNQSLLLFKNKFFKILFFSSLAILSIFLYLITRDLLYVLIGLMTFFLGISKHRGFTHSIFGFFLATSIVKLLASRFNMDILYYGFSLGYISHLLGDFFTVQGIQLFYPLKRRFTSPIMLKTGNGFYSVFIGLLALYTLFLLFKSLNI